MRLILLFIGAIPLMVSAGEPPVNLGSLKIHGLDKTIYVTAPWWVPDFVKVVDENEIVMNGGGRIYFSESPNVAKDTFWRTPLDGRHFSYVIDVSRVDCHCNSAAYFVEMPGPQAGDQGDYYCDANFVNNQWCPEYDLFEGNKHTIQVALHKCTGDGNQYWDCDRGGCHANAWNVNNQLMCPEDRCTINTNRPFTVSHYQTADVVNVWLEQEGRTVDFNTCDEDSQYKRDMAKSYGGMVFTASLWGGPDIDMNWLDGMTGCQGTCYIENQSVTFSWFNLW